MTEPDKNNTVDNVELKNNVSLVNEQNTSHNKLECDEIHKMFVACRNSDGENADTCQELLSKFKDCSTVLNVKDDNDNPVDETIFN